jgi:hypothetical protein
MATLNNIGDIYDQLLNKLGKDAFGNLVTPEAFNQAAAYVNMEKLNDFLEVSSQDREIVDDLRPFAKTTTLSVNPSTNEVLTPGDYIAYIQLVVQGTLRQIEMLTWEDYAYRLSTSLYYPTTDRPIATIQDDGIFVAPNLTNVILTYVREPQTPEYGYTIDPLTGLPVYDPLTSTQFEYPVDVYPDLVNMLYKYFAINIKDFNSLQTVEIEKGRP